MRGRCPVAQVGPWRDRAVCLSGVASAGLAEVDGKPWWDVSLAVCAGGPVQKAMVLKLCACLSATGSHLIPGCVVTVLA